MGNGAGVRGRCFFFVYMLYAMMLGGKSAAGRALSRCFFSGGDGFIGIWMNGQWEERGMEGIVWGRR